MLSLSLVAWRILGYKGNSPMHPLLVHITCIVFLKITTQASISSQSFILEIERLWTIIIKTVRNVCIAMPLQNNLELHCSKKVLILWYKQGE